MGLVQSQCPGCGCSITYEDDGTEQRAECQCCGRTFSVDGEGTSKLLPGLAAGRCQSGRRTAKPRNSLGGNRSTRPPDIDGPRPIEE